MSIAAALHNSRLRLAIATRIGVVARADIVNGVVDDIYAVDLQVVPRKVAFAVDNRTVMVFDSLDGMM